VAKLGRRLPLAIPIGERLLVDVGHAPKHPFCFRPDAASWVTGPPSYSAVEGICSAQAII
jgi:hypothetical protein